MAKKIVIEESYDGFNIVVDDERFHFDQEDDKRGLINVFKALGLNAEYEEIY